MLSKKMAAFDGRYTRQRGSMTISYCVFIIDHSWLREAERIRFSAKFPIKAAFDPVAAVSRASMAT